MADPSTTNYGWVKPTVGSDADTWGGVLNAGLDGIDSVVGNIASIVGIAGGELINLSGSVTGVSSSLAGFGASVGGVSTSLGAVSSSQVGVSASLGATNAALGAVSASVSANAASLGGVSASLSQVSSSLSGTNATAAGVSSSLAGISTSLGAAVSGTNASSIGYLGIPPVTKSANYTLALADAGKHFFFTASATLTIPANASVAFDPGTFFKASADSGVTLTVAIATDTLRNPAAGTSGARTVTGRGFVVVEKEKAAEWWVVGGANVT
jgi:hypothetical protein